MLVQTGWKSQGWIVDLKKKLVIIITTIIITSPSSPPSLSPPSSSTSSPSPTSPSSSSSLSQRPSKVLNFATSLSRYLGIRFSKFLKVPSPGSSEQKSCQTWSHGSSNGWEKQNDSQQKTQFKLQMIYSQWCLHNTIWATKKNPYYFPLYWLVNRDPYNGLLKSLYTWVV